MYVYLTFLYKTRLTDKNENERFSKSRRLRALKWSYVASVSIREQKQSPRCSVKKVVLKKISQISQESTFCWSIVLLSCRPWSLQNLLRTPVLKNICKRLHLTVFQEHYQILLKKKINTESVGDVIISFI